MPDIYKISKKWQEDVLISHHGQQATADQIGSDIVWENFKTLLGKSVTGGSVFTNASVSTYRLAYTTTTSYKGGVLDPNGDIHFVPFNANRGQKISRAGVVSTYSLVISTVTSAYAGGVLSPSGDIYFVPHSAAQGQRVSASGVVSTYSLVYTVSTSYDGGILSLNGEIDFIPYSAVNGQKLFSNTAVPYGIGVCCSPHFNKY